jgi:hypothetical protein
MYFFPNLTIPFAMHFRGRPLADIAQEAVHNGDVGQFSTIIDMRIPKVLSTRRKNVL